MKTPRTLLLTTSVALASFATMAGLAGPAAAEELIISADPSYIYDATLPATSDISDPAFDGEGATGFTTDWTVTWTVGASEPEYIVEQTAADSLPLLLPVSSEVAPGL